MSCKACSCSVGIDYTFLLGGTCDFCSSHVVGPYSATYEGMEVGYHKFLNKNVICPSCRRVCIYSFIRCEENMDVTEEFNVMFHRKESHWIGGSNAKRKS